MATWLIPFGFIGGVAFSLSTNLHTFSWAGEIGDRVIGGLLGAIGGAMGSVFIGGGGGIALVVAMLYRIAIELMPENI